MKKFTFPFFICFTLLSFSQEPSFKITNEVYESLPADIQQKLLPHLQIHSIAPDMIETELYADEQTLIKQWVGAHPEVKLMSKEVFLNLSPERKLTYNFQNFVLIYEGTSIRYTDILNFEAQ